MKGKSKKGKDKGMYKFQFFFSKFPDESQRGQLSPHSTLDLTPKCAAKAVGEIRPTRLQIASHLPLSV